MNAVEWEDDSAQRQAREFAGRGEFVSASARELRAITRRLRLISALVLLVSAGSFGVLLWSIAARSSYEYEGNADFFVALNIVVAMSTIALLGTFEVLRKRGDAIFQEMSDELQWHVGRPDARDAPRERPLFDVRVALRTFSAAADLPLIPGRYGGAVYAAVNLAVAVAAVFIYQSTTSL
jgi:hypothetical protein